METEKEGLKMKVYIVYKYSGLKLLGMAVEKAFNTKESAQRWIAHMEREDGNKFRYSVFTLPVAE